MSSHDVREGQGTEGRGTEVGGEDLAKYWFDVRPGGQRDGVHEGTAYCGPEGVHQVHRGLVQGVGADGARVQLTEEAGNGPRAAVDGGVLEAGGLGASRVRDDIWGGNAQTKEVDLCRAQGAE